MGDIFTNKWDANLYNINKLDLKFNLSNRLSITNLIKNEIDNKKICMNVHYINNESANIIFYKTQSKVLLLGISLLGIKESLDGESWIVALKPSYNEKENKFEFKNEKIFALKIVPQIEGEIDISKREIDLIKKASKLVINNFTPNLQIFYGQSICNKMPIDYYKNQRLKNKLINKKAYKNKAFMIFYEQSQSDLEHYLRNHILDTRQIKSLIFQVMHGLAMLNKYYALVHFDLHLGNILYNKEQNYDYIHYKIDEIDYYIPAYGAVFTIWDYGRSVLLQSDMENIIKKKILFHMRRHFNVEFEYLIDNIKNNLDKNPQYYKYLYSYDTYRFILCLSLITKNMKFNKSLIDKLLTISKNDLTIHLPGSSAKNFAGAPINILRKYFKEFTKKPITGKISRMYTDN